LHLGVLMAPEENDPEGKTQLSGFTQALAALGWIEGRNLRLDVRWGGGDANRARIFAKELVALQPDVILSEGTPVTAAFQRETRTIPIVFVVVTDPVGDGSVAGLPHPGGNITGFITSESAITAKMLDFLREISPGAARNNIPAIYPWRPVVTKNNGLLSYGPDLKDIVRRGAPYVDQIFRGAKPADLPVQVPVKFDLAINTKTSKALGLTVPPSMLLRADELIE